MSEARSITNLIGNAVATVVISKSEGAFAMAGGELSRGAVGSPGFDRGTSSTSAP
jgi:Na+/H+-dicarboxylate symporter